MRPFNPNPQWPAGYFQVLDELGIETKRHAFYAHWVRQFFNIPLPRTVEQPASIPPPKRRPNRPQADTWHDSWKGPYWDLKERLP